MLDDVSFDVALLIKYFVAVVQFALVHGIQGLTGTFGLKYFFILVVWKDVHDQIDTRGISFKIFNSINRYAKWMSLAGSGCCLLRYNKLKN